jgi:hypothetical protein
MDGAEGAAVGIWDWGVRRTVDESGKGRTEWTWFAAWLFVVICGGLFYFPFNLMMIAASSADGADTLTSSMFALSAVVTALMIVTGVLAIKKDAKK